MHLKEGRLISPQVGPIEEAILTKDLLPWLASDKMLAEWVLLLPTGNF